MKPNNVWQERNTVEKLQSIVAVIAVYLTVTWQFSLCGVSSRYHCRDSLTSPGLLTIVDINRNQITNFGRLPEHCFYISKQQY